MTSENLIIKLPEHVENIIRKLNDSGYEAFAVGGCIRDAILGRKASDWDVATSALPQDVQRIFEKTVETGILHGTVSVITEGMSYEVTTYRTENSYSDFRHPDNVKFGVSLSDDLGRRDFTVNALAFHPDCGLIDRFGGLNDINNKVIRTVGNADARFAEDALRMLRAVRFSAQLGFEIEPETFESIKRNCGLIRHISVERVRDELTGIILSDKPDRLADLFYAGLLKHILPELDRKLKDLNETQISDVLRIFKYTVPGKTARWSLVEYICESSGQTAKRLRFDGRTVETVGRIARSLGRELGDSPSEVRKTVSEVGKDIFPCILHLRKALVHAGITYKPAQNKIAIKKSEGTRNINIDTSAINRTKRIFKEILRKKEPLAVRELAINGNDLKELGIREGTDAGVKLKGLLDAVLENPALNNRDDLMRIAEKMTAGNAKQTD